MISIISTRRPVSIVEYQSVIAGTFIVTLRRNDRWKERGREEEEEEGREKKNSVIYFTSAVASSIAAIKFDGTEFRNAVRSC